MRARVVLLMLSVLGAVVACSDGTDGGGSTAIDGRWQQIGESLVDGEVRSWPGSGQWQSLVIYEDGKLTTDDSCRGTVESAGDGPSRLTFDCALGSVICDGSLVSDVKDIQSYTDENGDSQEAYFAYDEALKLTCPDDETYVFVREDEVPPTNVDPTPATP